MLYGNDVFASDLITRLFRLIYYQVAKLVLELIY